MSHEEVLMDDESKIHTLLLMTRRPGPPRRQIRTTISWCAHQAWAEARAIVNELGAKKKRRNMEQEQKKDHNVRNNSHSK